MSALPLLMVYKCQPKISDTLWSLEQDQHLEANSHQLFNPYGLICFLDTPALSLISLPPAPSAPPNPLSLHPSPLPWAFASHNLSPCISSCSFHSPTPTPPLPLSIDSPFWWMLHWPRNLGQNKTSVQGSPHSVWVTYCMKSVLQMFRIFCNYWKIYFLFKV